MILHSSDSCEIGFDIETVKDVDMIDKLPKPKVKYGNTKDPAKRKIMDEKAKEKQIADMALNPFYGRICSYAIYGNEGKISKYSVMNKVNELEEIRLINEIFQDFANTNTIAPTIITFKGEKFDLRFLYTRAVILGIELPSGCVSFKTMTKRYENENHIDLMTILYNYGEYGSLENAAYAILGEKKLDHDFSKFIELIETGRGNEIGEYNLQDARLTYELYKRVQPLFLGV